MADKITSQQEDFSQWYQDIVLQAQLADYSPVKGCMVIRPNGYAVWEAIQREFNNRIKALGVRNAYFPVFIPESFLQKEAEHVEGFAPQLAVVTHAGGKKLEEPLVVRPTSETIINTMFAKWIQSYRDLPLLINQWANVVRWEMRTRLFLRTTEFLWQEGHTCHATAEESSKEALLMLGVYKEFSESVLAMPVMAGLKSDSEKFPGALNTYSIEGLMQDGKALQAGTSHDLSTNFAKAFNTRYLAQDGTEKFVHQTSWGVSTRLVGGVIMTHSDDRGLILPPKLAFLHVVIIPILGKAAKDPALSTRIYDAADRLVSQIQKASSAVNLGYAVEVKIDRDETKQPGWKFHEYELLGIPLRVELGPRDLENKQVMVMRRDRSEKAAVPFDGLADYVVQELNRYQTDLFVRARERTEKSIHKPEKFSDFKKALEGENGGFMDVAWCGQKVCEEIAKAETKATLRNMPLSHENQVLPDPRPCCICEKKGNNVKAYFAKSY